MSSGKPDKPKNPDQETFRNKGKAPVRDATGNAGAKEGRIPLKEHANPAVRFFAKAGFMVWVIVLVVGLLIAFTFALFLV